MKIVVNQLADENVKIKDTDMGSIVISGLFVKETTKGKLDELNFLPFHKKLSGMQLKLSDLRKAGAMWQSIDNLNKYT